LNTSIIDNYLLNQNILALFTFLLNAIKMGNIKEKLRGFKKIIIIMKKIIFIVKVIEWNLLEVDACKL